MKGKIFTLLLILFSSNVTFANITPDSSNLHRLKQQEVMTFGFNRAWMVHLRELEGTLTFYVDPESFNGKKSDAITVICDRGIFKVHAGETESCHVSKGKGYLGVGVDDFKNGSTGTITQS